jgi:hypothetical protein
MLFYIKTKSGIHRISGGAIRELKSSGQLDDEAQVLSMDGEKWMNYPEFIIEAKKTAATTRPSRPVKGPSAMKRFKKGAKKFIRNIKHRKTFILGASLVILIFVPFLIPGESRDDTKIVFPFAGVLFQQSVPGATAQYYPVAGLDQFAMFGVLAFSGVTLMWTGYRTKNRISLAITLLIIETILLINLIAGSGRSGVVFLGTSFFWLLMGLKVSFSTCWTWTMSHRRSTARFLALLSGMAMLLAVILPIADGNYWSGCLTAKGTGIGLKLLVAIFMLMAIGAAALQGIRVMWEEPKHAWFIRMGHLGVLIAMPILLMFVIMGLRSNGFTNALQVRDIYNTIAGMILTIAVHAIGAVGLVHLLRGMPEPKSKDKSSKVSKAKDSKKKD